MPPNSKVSYQYQSFATQQDLFDYIESDEYFWSNHPAVCFGFEVTNNSPGDTLEDVEVVLYFNDQVLMGGAGSIGIPNQ